MTCIVALEEGGICYMGGDSAGVAGLSITVRSDDKIFVNGPFIIGGTTSFRMLQLLQYKFDPPKQTNSQTDMKYMVTDFIDAVRKLFVDNGFGSGSAGGSFMVGYHGKLYTIGSDYQVGISAIGYNSVGCGSEIAMGALFASKGKKPEERVKIALEAAAEFSAGVIAPFYYLTQPAQEKPKPAIKKK